MLYTRSTMAEGKPKVLGVIGARAGSKSVPHKNIKPLLGKPLFAWIAEAAKNSKYVTRLIMSTDSPEYARVAREHGVETPFLRPAELSGDKVPDWDYLNRIAERLVDKFLHGVVGVCASHH